MKALEITLAAIGGAVVGAAAALLLAPQEGKRTRKQIREFVREKCPFAKENQVEQIADELEDKLKEAMDDVLESKGKKK